MTLQMLRRYLKAHGEPTMTVKTMADAQTLSQVYAALLVKRAE